MGDELNTGIDELTTDGEGATADEEEVGATAELEGPLQAYSATPSSTAEKKSTTLRTFIRILE